MEGEGGAEEGEVEGGTEQTLNNADPWPTNRFQSAIPNVIRRHSRSWQATKMWNPTPFKWRLRDMLGFG